MALPSVPQEKEQGAVQAEAQLAAFAPPPLEPTPAQADEAAFAPNLGTPIPNQGTPAAPQVQQPNMWRIPNNYQGVLGQQQKTAMERQQDVGYLWQALASDPKASPVVRQIAESLLGGRAKRGAV